MAPGGWSPLSDWAAGRLRAAFDGKRTDAQQRVMARMLSARWKGPQAITIGLRIENEPLAGEEWDFQLDASVIDRLHRDATHQRVETQDCQPDSRKVVTAVPRRDASLNQIYWHGDGLPVK